jgi:antitoxin HigA-1
MIPTNRIATHPGEILLGEFLVPMKLSQAALAATLGISLNRVNEIVKGKRGITAETALLLAGHFGTSPEFWMNLQVAHDLSRAMRSFKPRSATKRGKKAVA